MAVGWPVHGLRPSTKQRNALIVVAAGLLVFAIARYRGEQDETRLISLLVAVMVIAVIARHPVGSLAVLIGYLPVQEAVLAFLYNHGAPGGVVKGMGYLKEAVLVAFIVDVVRTSRDARRRPMTRVDHLGLGFVALATVYLVLPAFVTGIFGGQPSAVRVSAWRLEILFVAYLLVCRLRTWTSRDVRILENAIMVAGTVLAAGGIWEIASSSAYNTFMIDTVGFQRFASEVRKVTPECLCSVIVRDTSGGSSVIRVGSWLGDALNLAWCMVLPIVIALRRLGSARRAWVPLIVAMSCAITLVYTLTRSAIVGGAVAAAIVTWGAVSKRYSRGTALVAIVALGAVCLIPFLPASLLNRITGHSSGAVASAQQHTKLSSSALHRFLTTPLGDGLGSNPVTGNRLGTSNKVYAENYYLQVGIELGWLGLLLFAALVLSLLFELKALLRTRWHPQVIAIAAALAGLGISAFFLQTFSSFQVAIPLFALCGVATSLGSARREDPDDLGTDDIDDDARAGDDGGPANDPGAASLPSRGGAVAVGR